MNRCFRAGFNTSCGLQRQGGRWFWEAKNTSELRSMRLQRYHFTPAGLAGHGRRDSKPQPGWSTRTLGKRRQRRVQNKMPSSDRLYAGTAVSCQTDPLLDNDRKVRDHFAG